MSGKGRKKNSPAGAPTRPTLSNVSRLREADMLFLYARDSSYDDWGSELTQAAAANRNLRRIVFTTSTKRRRRGAGMPTLPQERFIQTHGIAVDPLRNGNCGIDAVGLAVSYLQTNNMTPVTTSNNANNAEQLRSELRNHAQIHQSAFARNFENLIDDSELDADKWFTKNVLDRLYLERADYSTKANVPSSQYLDGDYGCPIVADFFQAKVILYDLEHGSTTIYSPDISGHRTRRRTPQVTSQHLTYMQPPTPGSVAIMMYNGHFYWLMPRPLESDRSNASSDTDVVEVVDDGSSDKSDSGDGDDDDDGDDGREGVSENTTDNNDDAIVVSSSDEGGGGGGGGDDDDDETPVLERKNLQKTNHR